MKFVVIALIIAVAFAAHPVNDKIYREILDKADWTPMKPEENPFAYVPEEEIKAMMGTKLRPFPDVPEGEVRNGDSFDARDKWGASIHEIRDQARCGSCWAFGATEALSDRFAIAGEDVILSPQYLVSCDNGNYGCNGGYLDVAWNFMKGGVPTDKCYSYTSGGGDSGRCKSTCDDGSAFTMYKTNGAHRAGSAQSAMNTIKTEGPIEAAFTVYQDFMNYKSGVYEHKTGSMLGGHAIKCLGWGTEDGKDYWLMANSWSTSWGDKGFFKIKRGDCGSNNQLYYGKANVKAPAFE